MTRNQDEEEKEYAVSTQASYVGGNDNDCPEVMEFLATVNMHKYYQRMIDNGIEDEETILELNDSHLDAMRIPLGHKLKMLKRIKTIR